MADKEKDTPEIEEMNVGEVEEYIADMSYEEAEKLFGDDERKGVKKALASLKEEDEEASEERNLAPTKAQRRGLYRPNKDGKVVKVKK